MLLYIIGIPYVLLATFGLIVLLGKLFCVRSLTKVYDTLEFDYSYGMPILYIAVIIGVMFGIAISFKIEALLVITFASMLGMIAVGLVIVLVFLLVNAHTSIVVWHNNLKRKKNM